MYKSYKIHIGDKAQLNKYLSTAKDHNIKFRWNQFKERYEARRFLSNGRSLHAIIKQVGGFWRLYMHVDINVKSDFPSGLHRALRKNDEINRIGRCYLEFKGWKGIPVI